MPIQIYVTFISTNIICTYVVYPAFIYHVTYYVYHLTFIFSYIFNIFSYVIYSIYPCLYIYVTPFHRHLFLPDCCYLISGVWRVNSINISAESNSHVLNSEQSYCNCADLSFQQHHVTISTYPSAESLSHDWLIPSLYDHQNCIYSPGIFNKDTYSLVDLSSFSPPENSHFLLCLRSHVRKRSPRIKGITPTTGKIYTRNIML